MLKNRNNWILLAGDLLALFIFIFIGQLDHETVDQANPILGALPQAASFALPWLVAAALLGAYPSPSSGPTSHRGDFPGLPRFLARSLNAWLVAAPLGMVLRALLLGRATIPVPFFLVTMGLGGAFLLGWRLIFGVLQGRLKRARSDA